MVAVIARRLRLGGVPIQLGVLEAARSISGLGFCRLVASKEERHVRSEEIKICRADGRPYDEARDGAVVCELIESLLPSVYQSRSNHREGHLLTAPGAPERPMYANIMMAPVTRTALTGTPDRQARRRLVINSGPVCPRRASVCKTLEAMYIELMAQVKAEKVKTALKKWASFGIPASTTAMMKTERALTDVASPLIKGCSMGTTNEAVKTARE